MMRNKIALTAIFIFAINVAFSQMLNATVKDPKLDNQEILIGYCNLDGLKSGTLGVYFESQYELYSPSEKSIEKMRTSINNVDIVIVFGSWCSDSKIQLPRFYKILDKCGYNDMHLKMIGVNRDKNGLSVNVTDMNIERVPTFIVYQNGVELGRIIETPKKSLEKDLARIIGRAK